jgi:hypothetical protein
MSDTIISVKKIDDYPKKELENSGLVKIKRDKIYAALKKIEDSNMRKYHSSLQCSAAYDWIVDRCAIKSDEDHFWIFKDRYDAMVKLYSSDKVHCPTDLKLDILNPLVRMFLEGGVSEC